MGEQDVLKMQQRKDFLTKLRQCYGAEYGFGGKRKKQCYNRVKRQGG